MDKFLVYYSLRLNCEEIDLNRPIISKENESVIKNFPIKKSPGLDGLAGKFYQTFREYQYFSNLSKKLNRREHFQTHFMRPALS